MFYHGSHPEHPMRISQNPPLGQLCSICKASAHSSAPGWYHCTQEGCHYMLCRKCQEIDEQLFEVPQVVIRSPVLPYENMDVCLRTRPRSDSYVLCPLYPARLMVAVSSAKGSIDPGETYYRLGTGGWTNASHVVRVVPSQQLIEELARAHIADDPSQNNLMHLSVLLECINESYRLMEERSPYGLIMASLIYYPLIQCCPNLRLASAESRMAFVRASLGYIHYVFHYVLDEANQWLKSYDPKVKTTVLTLYVELLGKSLIVARDLTLSQNVTLPRELEPLVVETARIVVDLVPILDNGEKQYAETGSTSMCSPSIVSHQRNFAEEQLRLLSCCHEIVKMAGWLLVHNSAFTYGRKDIIPFRVAVSLTPGSETLERLLCQVTTNALEKDSSLQRRVHDLDVVEVAVSLAGRASCTESELAVFRLIAAVAHESQPNISQISSLVITPLMELASNALNTLVANAAFDCFAEFAHNGSHFSQSCCCASDEGVGYTQMCSAVLHPNEAPRQMMYVYKACGKQVLLCQYCSEKHPPMGGVSVCAPQQAHFHCHCRYCPSEHTAKVCSPPCVGSTPAVQRMMKEGITHLMLFWLGRGESAVANSVGRLSLKIPVPAEVIVGLCEILLKQGLVGYGDAALAVTAKAHLPDIKELQRRHPNAAISQYLPAPATTLDDKNHFADCTPGRDSDDNDADGLSPSPDVALRSNGAVSVGSDVTPPVADILMASRAYLNTVI
uniref:Uncharacterized protein n=1 Tax=Trypanosoma congolense (strain IL3000) TaxID=1068625 RepID=G0UWY6_TRYCI|nr:conserved hypothetical protein [Trypanosoma congolense IL3000]